MTCTARRVTEIPIVAFEDAIDASALRALERRVIDSFHADSDRIVFDLRAIRGSSSGRPSTRHPR